jgi:hypothetical protein
MDRHYPGSSRVYGVRRHQEDVRVWIPDHLYLDPAVRTALPQYLDWGPACEMLPTAEWIAGAVQTSNKHLSCQLCLHNSIVPLGGLYDLHMGGAIRGTKVVPFDLLTEVAR